MTEIFYERMAGHVCIFMIDRCYFSNDFGDRCCLIFYDWAVGLCLVFCDRVDGYCLYFVIVMTDVDFIFLLVRRILINIVVLCLVLMMEWTVIVSVF